MKKFKEYSFEDNTSKVKEPDAVYARKESISETYPVWSKKEALKTGMPLEESRRLMFERIQKDFRDK